MYKEINMQDRERTAENERKKNVLSLTVHPEGHRNLTQTVQSNTTSTPNFTITFRFVYLRFGLNYLARLAY